MECPICKIGEVEHEFFDADDMASAELMCTNEECPSSGYGIYCWLNDFIDNAEAEAFYEEWQISFLDTLCD